MIRENKGFKAIFGQSLSFYKCHWFRLIRITIPFFGATIALNINYWSKDYLLQNIIMRFSHGVFRLMDDLITLGVLLLLLISVAAIFRTIYNLNQGTKFKFFSTFKEAFLRLGSLLYIYFLSAIKTFGWALLFIVPGILFAIFYSLAPLALIVDEVKGNRALQFSKKIVKKNIVKYLDYLLYTFVILYLLCVTFISLLDWVGLYFLKRGRGIVFTAVNYIEYASLFVAALFFFVFCYFLYEELKARMEAED